LNRVEGSGHDIKLRLRVFVPASILSTQHSLEFKTLAVWQVLRAAAIFRAEVLVVYTTFDSKREDIDIFKKVVKYLLTPPYLRRILIPLEPELRRVGVIPPLALPLHSVSTNPEPAELRLGYIEKCPYAFIGLKKQCLVVGKCIEGVNLLKVISVKPLRCKLAKAREDVYLGPNVEFKNSLGEAVKEYCRDFLVVVSSRKGVTTKNDEVAEKLAMNDDICVLFGSPRYDPDELEKHMGGDLAKISEEVARSVIWLNTAPEQGVRSIRTTEATYITLSALVNIKYLLKAQYRRKAISRDREQYKPPTTYQQEGLASEGL